jgi:uncharacterized protein YfaS (alpha-2-macroglobulin family)
MKNTVWVGVLAFIVALACVPVALSQTRGTVVYSRIFTPTENASVEYYSSAQGDVEFTLERVENDESVLPAIKDWRSPSLPEGAKTTLLRRLPREANQRDYVYGTLSLGRLETGVYAVRARQGNTVSTALVIVSRLALVVKASEARTLVWSVDSLTGQPVAARVYRQGGPSSLADGDGLTRLTRVKDETVLLAKFGESWALSGSSVQSWNVKRTIGYAYTERPVYRPGDTVFVKGILRDARTLQPRSSAVLRVRVYDQGSNTEVYRGSATTNAYGSFSVSLELSGRAKTGQYVVGVTGAEGTEAFNGLFKVESYRKPEYAVTVTLPKKAVQGDRAVTAKIAAAYLFGGKVSNARVRYTVTRSRVYDWWWYANQDEREEAQAQQRLEAYEQGYDYGDYAWWQPPSETIISEQGRLNAQGELSLPLPLTKDKDGATQTYTVTASVEDETRQVVAGSAALTAAPSSRSVRVNTSGYGYSVGEDITLNLETLDLQDKGVADSVRLEISRETWSDSSRKTQAIKTLEVKTDARGQGKATFKPGSSGYYRVDATVSDPQGRVAKAQWWIWVVGNESEVWSYRFDDLKITLDKTRYAPGETVTALVQNPRPGAPVLVTLEGGDVGDVRVLRGRAPVLRYRFTASSAQTPNVFLTATAVNGGRVYSSERRILVDNPKSQLFVGIKPAKARFSPAETTTLQIQTTDSSGVGVPAELGVSVVDEGVYLIQADTTPDITEFFHRPRRNTVGTQFSTNWYFQGVPRPAVAQAAPSAASGVANEALADSARRAESAPEPRVRQDFKDTALWRAQVVTDAKGSASLELKFPDNLTTWRVTAKGITQSGSAGEARKGILVTQDVIARLGVPRVLVRGDRTQASVVMNNNLTTSANATLELRTTGLTASGDTKRQTTVRAGDRADLRVNLNADTIGTARLQARALTGSASDAMELPVTVKARGFTERKAFSSDTTAGAQTVTIPSDANLETAALRVLVTPSLTAAVSPALEYLVGYPYGCSEQTMSRFLPALLASRTLKQNDLPAETVKKLPEYVKSGIERLENFQHGDGGWGFWEYDDSTLEMTAYVMSGLLRAKALGAKVSEAALERGTKFLQTAVNQERYSRADRASGYLTLAIAARAPVDAMRRFAAQDALEPSVLAKLAIAFSRADADRDAQDALERLITKRQETARGVSWKNPDDQRYRWWWSWDDNPVMTTAVALEALARVSPKSPLIPKVAAWLLTERQGARWVSTRDTAAVIEAALSLNEPQSDKPVAVTVLLNGATVKTLNVTRQATLELNAEAGLKAGRNILELRSPTRILYSADSEYTREPAELVGANNGVTVTRSYQKLEATFSDNQYTFKPVTLERNGTLQPLTVGEYVLVTLKVSAQDARYLMLSDAIPAGFSAMETRALPLEGQRFEYWWEWAWNYWFSGLDIRDDRVDVYASALDGTNTVQYILRAETPGRYTALPTEAFLMYEPSVSGRSSAATFTVRDRGQ